MRKPARGNHLTRVVTKRISNECITSRLPVTCGSLEDCARRIDSVRLRTGGPTLASASTVGRRRPLSDQDRDAAEVFAGDTAVADDHERRPRHLDRLPEQGPGRRGRRGSSDVADHHRDPDPEPDCDVGAGLALPRMPEGQLRLLPGLRRILELSNWATSIVLGQKRSTGHVLNRPWVVWRSSTTPEAVHHTGRSQRRTELPTGSTSTTTTEPAPPPAVTRPLPG